MKATDMITKAEILKRMVEDDKYLEAWKVIKKIVARDKRYSFKAWRFCHEMIQKAEELRAEVRRT